MTGFGRATVEPSRAVGLPLPGFSVIGDYISKLAGWEPEGWRVLYVSEAHFEGIEGLADTWWGAVICRFGGRPVISSAYSGSVVEGFDFPAEYSEEGIYAVVVDGSEVPDVVFMLMGLNDYGWGGGRNQVMGGSPSASAAPEDIGGLREVSAVVSSKLSRAPSRRIPARSSESTR